MNIPANSAPGAELLDLLSQSPDLPRDGPRSSVFPTVGPELFRAVRAGGHRKIVLQVPAGLSRDAHSLVARIREEIQVPIVLAARACFGACDFPSAEEAPGCDAAIVLGHAPIPNVPIPRTTYFVEMRQPGGNPETLADLIQAAGLPARLGIVASVQHLELVAPLTEALRRRGIALISAEGDHRLRYPAQALGCNYTTAEALKGQVDGYLFLGTGRFHPLGLAFAVELPVWSLDPLQSALEPPIDRAALVRRRQLLVASCFEARRWGILVSSFAGQYRNATALALQQRARSRGHEAEVLVFGRLDPQDLAGRAIDAYVNTACPRIALDDSDLYPKPMLTPPEFLMALRELPLEPYRFDTYH
ncbi:MAG: diphthamide biosynthesis enzyme Dph2 [Thermoplasmata archaeon]